MPPTTKTPHGIAILGACLLLAFIFLTQATRQFDVANTVLSTIQPRTQLAQVSSVLNDGLVAHYTFDEGNGTTAADSAGSNHGTISGGATYVEGKIGRALSFDGVSGYVQKINPSWDFTSNPSPSFSISAWFKPKTCVDLTGIDLTSGAGLRLNSRSNSTWLFQLKAGRTNATSQVGTCVVDQWQHVAGVYDSIDNKLRLYINGNLSVTSNPVAETDTSNLIDELRISKGNAGIIAFNGLIDDARIYNRALGASEITELYNYSGGGDVVNPPPSSNPINGQCGTTASCSLPVITAQNPSPVSGQVGWWKFDEGSGATASDSSLNGANASFNGSPTPQWFNGIIGTALNFSNSSQYLSVANNTLLDIIGNKISISAWVNPTSKFFLDNAGTVLSKAGYNDGYRLMVDNYGQVQLQIGNSTGGKTLISNTMIPANKWSHIVATYDGSLMKIYINSVQDSKTLSSTDNIIHSATGVLIGSSGTSANHYSYHWNGLLDDIRVYNEALSASDIQTIYNGGVSSNQNTSPNLSSISSSVQTGSANITWTTDQPSDSEVEYDQSTNYSFFSPLNMSLVTPHNVSLSGLAPNTLYHYRVSSRNSSGNRTVSGDYTFTTSALANIAPVLSEGAPTGILPQNANEVLLAVTTNVKSVCKYSSSANVSYDSMPNIFLTTGNMVHGAVVSNLQNGSSYNYYVKCQDTSGNKNITDYSISFSVAPTVNIGNGQTYTVKKDGSGDYSTIQSCANLVKSGDTCLVYGGNYPERVSINNNGVQNNYITFKTSGTVIVKGFDVKGNYVKVDGFEITNNDNPSCLNGVYNYGIFVTGNYDVIVNNYIHDINNWGIAAYSSTLSVGGYIGHNRMYRLQYGPFVRGINWVVEGNEVDHLIKYCSSSSTADSDYSRFFGQTLVFRNNYYHGSNRTDLGTAHNDCFQNYDNDGPQSVTNNVLIKGNICMDMMQGSSLEEMNLYTKKSNNFLFVNNIFANSLGRSTGEYTVLVVHVPYSNFINNTFSLLGAGVVGYFDSYNVGNLYGIFKNNIVYKFGPYGYGPSLIDDTIYEDYNLEVDNNNRSNISTGYTRGVHDVTADPLFVNISNVLGPDNVPFTNDDGLRLQPNSPLCSAGENGKHIGAYSCDDHLPIIQNPSTPADFNHDGRVNATDLLILTSHWNQNNPTYDLNADGIVNSLDYVVMVKSWRW